MTSLLSLVALLAAVPSAPSGWFESPAGYGFRPPPGFQLDSSLPLGPTEAAGPAPSGVAERVDAAFSDLAGGGRSSLFVSIVEAPLPMAPSEAERLAALAFDFTKARLGAPLRIEWVDRVPAAGERVVEVAGRLSVSGEERVAQLAFVPAGERYLVVVASLPPDRFRDQGPQVEASLASLHLTKPPALSPGTRAGLGALIGAALGSALALGIQQRKWRARMDGSVRGRG